MDALACILQGTQTVCARTFVLQTFRKHHLFDGARRGSWELDGFAFEVGVRCATQCQCQADVQQPKEMFAVLVPCPKTKTFSQH